MRQITIGADSDSFITQSDFTAGLPITKGGTGAITLDGAQTNLLSFVDCSTTLTDFNSFTAPGYYAYESTNNVANQPAQLAPWFYIQVRRNQGQSRVEQFVFKDNSTMQAYRVWDGGSWSAWDYNAYLKDVAFDGTEMHSYSNQFITATAGTQYAKISTFSVPFPSTVTSVKYELSAMVQGDSTNALIQFEGTNATNAVGRYYGVLGSDFAVYVALAGSGADRTLDFILYATAANVTAGQVSTWSVWDSSCNSATQAADTFNWTTSLAWTSSVPSGTLVALTASIPVQGFIITDTTSESIYAKLQRYGLPQSYDVGQWYYTIDNTAVTNAITDKPSDLPANSRVQLRVNKVNSNTWNIFLIATLTGQMWQSLLPSAPWNRIGSPIATTSVAGIVKPGSGLDIAADGTLTAVQATTSAGTVTWTTGWSVASTPVAGLFKNGNIAVWSIANMTSVAVTTDTQFATIPVGFRPNVRAHGTLTDGTGKAYLCFIDPNGNVSTGWTGDAASPWRTAQSGRITGSISWIIGG